MALQTSGSIALNQVELEFDVYSGPTPFGMNGYYGDASDPLRVPFSGAISLNNFYGASRRSVRCIKGTSSDTNPRFGYSKYAGSSYYIPETGESAAAFGSVNRSSAVVTTSNSTQLACVVKEEFGTVDRIVIGMQGSSSNSGWTNVTFKEYPGATGYTLERSKMAFTTLSNTSPTTYAWVANAYSYSPAGSYHGVVQNVCNVISNTSTGGDFYVEFT